MEIRRLTDRDAESYSQLRLEALELEPWAFTESAEEHRAVSLDEIRAQLAQSSTGDNFVLGVFVEQQLAGMAGFFRRTGAKVSHRGGIWGVYVRRDCRSKGVGRALLDDLIAQLRLQSGLEQVSLAVSSQNAPAKRLYESLGFEVYGCERRALKIGDGYVDEELMVLYFDDSE